MSANPFAWRRWTETEKFLDERYADLLTQNNWAKEFEENLRKQTGTILPNWVDHILLNEKRIGHAVMLELGFKPYRSEDSNPVRKVYHHAGAHFPKIVLVSNLRNDDLVTQGVAIRCESLACFLEKNHVYKPIQGQPLGPYRECIVAEGPPHFIAVERRGYGGIEVYPSSLARAGQMSPQRTRAILEARELWQTRRRQWFGEDAAGFDHAETIVRRMIDLVGRDLACELVFEVEREYWQSRNRAARAQKSRQDELGLGWANHDHHTFRCSRRNFHRLIHVLEIMGFSLRENFHAGENAGWGAQVLEHSVTRIVIFADLDLDPAELETDFAHTSLEPLPRPNTVGLWVALHGESFLEAGMHHLEAQFDFDLARDGLLSQADVATMKPFSDFPFLKQAFTQGERWAVDPRRVEHALHQGWINISESEKFRTEGAIGSHLEILQRKEGYKGFNQQAVSAILAETDPRKVTI